jgi:amidohydrolase
MKTRDVVAMMAALFALGAVAPAPALGQEGTAALSTAEIERVSAAMVDVRHDLHRNPELGNREFRTAALVAEHLEALGLEVHTGIAHTGVVGILRGAHAGPVVAVRADMDALPVTEATGLPWASTVTTTYLGREVGVMHACGHDVHTAVQMGVAELLAGLRDRLAGTVMFIFQPAEEGAPPGEEGGAELMLAEGLFDLLRPDAVFGLHTAGAMDVGTLSYAVGPAYAASDRWTVTLRGEQGHGAAPHAAVDPTVMAAEAVLALQTIRSRSMNPMEAGVVSVGIMRGGERNNIIPMDVYLEGTARTFSEETRDLVERRMGAIFAGVAETHGGEADFAYHRGYPVTINDPDLTRRMAPSLVRVVGEERVRETGPVTASEDFSYFANEVPGFYFSLGVRAPGTNPGGHHSPTFLADDSAIEVGIRAMTTVVLDYLSAEVGQR